MEKIILVGYGGHAKSIADSIERGNDYQIVGYTDISPQKCRYKYLGGDEVLEEVFSTGISNAVVGIGFLGKGNIRQKMYSKLKEIGYTLPIITDPSAIVSDSAQIDEGTFIGKNAIVNAEAKIGKMCIINTNALVEHENVIGDFVHVAVGAVLCGQVKVGESSLIGANATVLQCRTINENQIVPAGDVIR